MRMWVICRPIEIRSGYASAARQGFSLLELLIVLTLLGLLAALVGPPLQRTYDRLVESSARDDVFRQLESLPVRVRATGRALEIPRGGRLPAGLIELPAGWVVQAEQPLRIERSGVCRASRMRIRGMTGQWTVALLAPYCRVRYAS